MPDYSERLPVVAPPPSRRMLVDLPQAQPGVSMAICEDPLGPTNRIVRLYTHENGQRVFRRGGLARIKAGDTVMLGSEPALGPVVTEYEDVLLAFRAFSSPRRIFAEVNGRRVVEWSETEKPRPPRPRIPLRRRIRRRADQAAVSLRRRLIDPLAERCGYVREDEVAW